MIRETRTTDVRIRGRSATLVAGGLTTLLALSACGSDSGSNDSAGSGGDGGTLTLYNAQHEDLMKLMVDGFTKQTGIKVNMRNGDDFELANQIVQEGKASPADVFVTENSPAMTLVDGAKGFTKVDPAALAQVPPQFAPKDGDWVGFAARSTVLAYNKTQLKPAQLPTTILDLAKPQWNGKVGIASAGADFQAIVSAVVAVEGEAKAAEWLKGLKANAKVYRGNNAVMQAVNNGEIQAGVIYHYYWYKDQAESGENSNNTSLHFFGHQDPGAFLSVSGAGVLATSKHQKQAQQLVKFLNGAEGQKILAASAAMEYPIGKGAAANKALKPLSELDPPTVEVSTLNGSKVVELMQQAGLL
jgi:iron(III) transport system substrate-binding protein